MRRVTFKEKKQYRLSTWNYGSPGYYFVTICTRDRYNYFGMVENGEMKLSAVGRLAQLEWISLPYIFDNISLDKFVIMPNYVHGIIIINNQKFTCRNLINQIPTIKNNPMQAESISLGYIIRQFKAKIKYNCNLLFGDESFTWQSRFYDRIIRNEKELNNVRIYIKNNPEKWSLYKDNDILKYGSID